MIGVGTANVDLDMHRHTFTSMLGNDGESWGLSYYGRIQHRGQFSPYEHSQFGQGSIIGIHLDTWHGELSFYKNRKPLGKYSIPEVCTDIKFNIIAKNM